MKAPKSEYDKCISNAGTLITKDFYQLGSLDSSYKKIEAKIIHITSSKGEHFFYSLSAPGKYSDKTATIGKDDLLEIQKVFKLIIEKSEKEKKNIIQYRETFFTTNDGFKIGYFQRSTSQTFFVDLDDHQSEDTFFFSNPDPLTKNMDKAIKKIKELKTGS